MFHFVKKNRVASSHKCKFKDQQRLTKENLAIKRTFGIGTVDSDNIGGANLRWPNFTEGMRSL